MAKTALTDWHAVTPIALATEQVSPWVVLLLSSRK